MSRLTPLCRSALLCSALFSALSAPWLAMGQQAPTASAAPTPALNASAHPSASAPATARLSPQWQQLSGRERQALAPLAEHWVGISDTQRSKWLVIARNFDRMPVAEQQLMQTRMKEWAALSPVQRNQARLNFNIVQSVSKDEKKTRWEAYQNLSDEEKRKLTASQLSPAKTAAPSAKPAPAQRLVQPAVRTMPPQALPARPQIDSRTLLPVPAPAPAPAPVAATEPLAPASAPMEPSSAPESGASPAPVSEASDS